MPILSHDEARAFYDWFGARQNTQAFYEDPATAELLAHGAFEAARSVLEFGCGTGRFAERLLDGPLPAGCTYLGVDASTTMVGLARARLARFGERAEVRRTSGSVVLDAADGGFDRFVSNFVLGLLSDADIRALIAEARRVLVPDGLLCLTEITSGESRLARAVMGAWRGVHALNARLVGGCRPVAMLTYLAPAEWEVRHRAVREAYGIAAEAVVAARRPTR